MTLWLSRLMLSLAAFFQGLGGRLASLSEPQNPRTLPMNPPHTLVFWTFRGMARPSVRIPDLGLVLVYGQEVEVPEDRVRMSRDLSMAITAKTVVRVLRPNLRPEPARTPPPASDLRSRPPEAATPPRPEVKAEPAIPPSREVKPEEGPPAWLADVLAQNKLLTAAVAQLTQQLESAPPSPPPSPSPPSSLGKGAAPSQYVPAGVAAEDEEDWPSAEPVFFVPDFEPRAIQGDVSQTVKGEVSAGESLAHSAALLSSLRGPGGRKRRRGGNPAPDSDSGEDT